MLYASIIQKMKDNFEVNMFTYFMNES